MLEDERKRRDALRHEFIEDYLLCGKKSLVERKKLVNEEGPEELLQIIQCLVDKSDPCIGYLYSKFIRATGNGLKENGESRTLLQKALTQIANSQAESEKRKEFALRNLKLLKRERDEKCKRRARNVFYQIATKMTGAADGPSKMVVLNGDVVGSHTTLNVVNKAYKPSFSSSPVAQPGGAPQPSPECDAGSPVASWLQAGSQTFGPGEGPDALMDDVDGLGETGGTAGVGQDVDSTSLRLTPYGFDATSLVELHQIAGTTVKVSPACIILELARMASTAGHGCIFFMAKDVMAAIQLQLVSQSHVGLHFDSRGLGRHAQFHKVYFLWIASSAPGCVHRLVEKLIEYDIQALYTNRRKALLTPRDLLFADVIPPADLSSRLRPFSLHPDSGEVVFDKEPSTAVDGRPPSHLPSTANSGGPLSPSAASSTDRSGLSRSNTGNDNSVHLPTAQVEKSSAVAPSKSATADNDRDGGAANTRDLPSGATSKSKDRGGAGTTRDGGGAGTTRDGGGAAGMTNDQAGAANTQTDNTNLRPPISPPAMKPPSVISGGSPLRQDLSTAASEARSISTEIAAAVLANLQSLAAPPSVTDELVTVVRQLKRKVDDLTERSEKLEALVVGGAAPRKKRAVKGKPNKAQLTPAAGKENGGAGPQKSPRKERAYGEGEEGEETRQPLAKKLRAEEPSPSGKGKDGKKKRGPLGYVNPNYAENGPGAKPVKPHTKPNEGPAATAPRADQIKDGSVAS